MVTFVFKNIKHRNRLIKKKNFDLEDLVFLPSIRNFSFKGIGN